MYKIMIIDDDPTSLAIGKALLEDQFQLSLAQSGHQALGILLREALPDLILLDMMMPDIDGMGMLQQLKRSRKLQDIPVIFLTSENDVNKEIQSYHAGAADFLRKPVNPGMLKIKINQQLTSLQLRRENREMKHKIKQFRTQYDVFFQSYFKE